MFWKLFLWQATCGLATVVVLILASRSYADAGHGELGGLAESFDRMRDALSRRCRGA